MDGTEELSDFKRGTKSVNEISVLLDLLWSTVSAIIGKWKHLEVTTAQPQSGRLHKLNELFEQNTTSYLSNASPIY